MIELKHQTVYSFLISVFFSAFFSRRRVYRVSLCMIPLSTITVITRSLSLAIA